VIKRAANCCEYCGLAQTGQEATFNIDYVVPRSRWRTINFGKSRAGLRLMFAEKRRPRLDPHTGEECLIRVETHGGCISAGTAVRMMGITTTGRATVWVYTWNRPLGVVFPAYDCARLRKGVLRLALLFERIFLAFTAICIGMLAFV
jgi:hypothetical protein